MSATSLATLWAFVALLIFFGILAYLNVPRRITDALDKRAEDIRTSLAEAKRLREEAQALKADYERRRLEAVEQSKEIVAQAKREAAAMTSEAKAQMEEYLQRRTRAAEEKITQAEVQAVAEVRARAVETAVAVAEDVIAARRDRGETDKLVDAAISEAGRRLS